MRVEDRHGDPPQLPEHNRLSHRALSSAGRLQEEHGRIRRRPQLNRFWPRLVRPKVRRPGQLPRRLRKRARCRLHPLRPGRERASSLPRNMCPRRPIGHRHIAQLLAQLPNFVAVLLPHLRRRRALFTARGNRPVLPRVLRGSTPLVDGALRARRAVRPSLTQPRQGQVACQPAPAIPDGLLTCRRSDGYRVAGDHVVAAGREPGPHEHPTAP